MAPRIAGALSAVALAFVVLSLAACGDEETTTTTTVTAPATAPSTTDSTTSSTTSTTSTTGTESTTTGTTTTESEDVSGNCDEAEHADDPECSGGVIPSDDNSGSGGTGPG
jgi:hypothetical protein